jgi:septal ring factor EnvC (AmiA/AmiB activator)
MCTSAYQALLEEHRKDMSSLEAQIKDAGKQLKATERAISIRNKKVAAVNKKDRRKAGASGKVCSYPEACGY